MANEHLTGHANPWRTVEHARDWIARMEREPRDRSEELQTLVRLLPFEADARIRVLELGAGHGALTEYVLEAFPHASVVALDLQPVMIEEGKRRLARYADRLQYVQWDLEQPGWPDGVEGPFDAVVSSLAVHHLNRKRKAALARQVFDHLRPGGVLINLDYTHATSENLAQRYRRAQAGSAAHDDHRHGGHGQHLAGGHATDSLFEQLGDLHEAGFEDVDVFWKRLGLAMFGATRPG